MLRYGHTLAPTELIAFTRVEILTLPKETLVKAAFAHLLDEERAGLANALYADIVRSSRLRIWGLKNIMRNVKGVTHTQRCARMLQFAVLRPLCSSTFLM